MYGNQSIFLLSKGKAANDVFAPYQRLRQEFCHQGEFLSPDEAVEWLACYDRDGQSLHTMRPLLVFQPYSASVIAPFIQACNQDKIPLTIRCGGTGLAGGSVASQGGIVLLTGHLRTILHYDTTLGQISVEPGVTPRQINQVCDFDGWYLPIEMATAGVAGLGGCISSQARGYHQTRHSLLSSIVSIFLIDGLGRELEVPASLIYGAEGLFGVVVRITLQLNRIPQKRMVFRVAMTWSETLEKLDVLRQHSALTSILWEGKDAFTYILEGDDWRIKGTFHHLEKLFNPIAKLETNWQFSFPYPPSGHGFIVLSHALSANQIPLLIPSIESLCEYFHLQSSIWSNLLDGSLQLLLFSTAEPYLFSKQLENFLVAWINIIESYQGVLVSRHGVGSLFHHYLPPFLPEEELQFLQKLQETFDPQQLFNRDRFFPVKGKSLEKVRME